MVPVPVGDNEEHDWKTMGRLASACFLVLQRVSIDPELLNEKFIDCVFECLAKIILWATPSATGP